MRPLVEKSVHVAKRSRLYPSAEVSVLIFQNLRALTSSKQQAWLLMGNYDADVFWDTCYCAKLVLELL